MKKFFTLFLFFIVFGLSGCASTNDASDASTISHPNTDSDSSSKTAILETTNVPSMHLSSSDAEITPDLFPKTSMSMHELNMNLIYALKPSLDEYKTEKISFVHTGFSNFLKNLHEPLYAINSILQLDFSATANSIGRFTINSTAGLLGVMDTAGSIGLKRDKRDFGQTLGAYGVPMGGFFVMPVYAQTTTRDISGKVVDTLINPINYVFSWGVGLFISLSDLLMDLYESYDFILTTHETSLNSYNTFKTMYLQNRQKVINDVRIFPLDSDASSSDTTTDTTTDETKNSPDTSAYDFDM